MNSWQFFCRIVLVKALPPTTKIVLSYCFSLLTSAIKSLSPLTMVNALMIVRERHLEGVESQIDGQRRSYRRVARGRAAPSVPRIRKLPRKVFHPSPVRVRDLGDDFAPFLQLEYDGNVELFAASIYRLFQYCQKSMKIAIFRCFSIFTF